MTEDKDETDEALKRWPHAEQDHRTRCFNKGAAEQ
jgi:hypothetical protein